MPAQARPLSPAAADRSTALPKLSANHARNCKICRHPHPSSDRASIHGIVQCRRNSPALRILQPPECLSPRCRRRPLRPPAAQDAARLRKSARKRRVHETYRRRLPVSLLTPRATRPRRTRGRIPSHGPGLSPDDYPAHCHTRSAAPNQLREPDFEAGAPR